MAYKTTDWTKAKADAQKAVSPKGKLPKARVEVDSLLKAAEGPVNKFYETRDALELTLLKAQNAFSAIKLGAAQYKDLCDDATFGLDEDDPADQKKMQAGQKLLVKSLDDMIKTCDARVEGLKKLNAILTHLKKLLAP